MRGRKFSLAVQSVVLVEGIMGGRKGGRRPQITAFQQQQQQPPVLRYWVTRT